MFDHLLLLLLESDIFEVSPFCQDLHGLNVFDCSKLISVVLVAAEGVKVHLFAEAFVLSLDDLQDVGDLVALVDLIVIDTDN